jgi:hypothetical protein
MEIIHCSSSFHQLYFLSSYPHGITYLPDPSIIQPFVHLQHLSSIHTHLFFLLSSPIHYPSVLLPIIHPSTLIFFYSRLPSIIYPSIYLYFSHTSRHLPTIHSTIYYLSVRSFQHLFVHPSYFHTLIFNASTYPHIYRFSIIAFIL